MVKKKRKTRIYGNCSRDRPDSLCCLELTTNNSHLSLHVCFSLHNLASCIPPSSPDHDFSTFLDPPIQSSFYFDLFALAEVEAEIKVVPNKKAYGLYFRCLDLEQYSTFYQNTFKKSI